MRNEADAAKTNIINVDVFNHTHTHTRLLLPTNASTIPLSLIPGSQLVPVPREPTPLTCSAEGEVQGAAGTHLSGRPDASHAHLGTPPTRVANRPTTQLPPPHFFHGSALGSAIILV